MKKQKKIVAALTVAFALFAFAAHTVDYRAQQIGRAVNETVCAATEEDNFADNAVIVTLKASRNTHLKQSRFRLSIMGLQTNLFCGNVAN